MKNFKFLNVLKLNVCMLRLDWLIARAALLENEFMSFHYCFR